MKMPTYLLFGLLAMGWCLTIAGTAHASLIGDEVTASITGTLGTWTPATAIVGAGIEYILIKTNVTFTADLSADALTVTYENTSLFPDVTVGAQTFLFEDLDWVGMTGSIIGLVEISNNFPGLGMPITTSFTSDSITLDVAQTNTNPGDLFSATYSIVATDQQPIPEPSTMLLFGTGMLGLIAYARRPATGQK